MTRTLLRTVVPLLVAIGVSGCLVLPDPATEAAEGVYGLYVAVLIMAGLVFVGVEGMIIYSVFRYRRRDDRLPAQTHGNTLVEIIWTAIPTVIVFILFGLSIATLAQVEARADEPGVEIEVTGGQWYWEFRYLDGDDDPDNDYVATGTIADPPVMGVPLDEPVRLSLHSPDVIHSFFVPRFLIKRDVVPIGASGDPNELEFTVKEEGTFTGQCAEFCGDLHADMTFVVQSMSREAFDQWLADAKAGATPAPTVSVPPDATEVTLVAEQIAWDTHELTVPAGEPFTIVLQNLDAAGIPHDVGIYTADEELVFRSQQVPGGETATISVPALEAGEYIFICVIHPVPDMTGTLTVE